ncbi:synaptotagmin-like protein 2 isoform X6 [Chiloscyllium plagiosum]|uniref:synaptotagmin-like protein 2 isoform X6 n=1 Tax=Chiloscyllium plagiosum TaxID=36176 RepID=UPI001CB88151|nr:synaptotagmin-like protein 2 isoform X6 [Chiloscyllium plagiosum]
MIDLSHLTEEEQVSIMRVLQRDAELRKVEEKRVRHVQESVKNEVQCKNMTGEWFYKAKAKRHKDTLHGAELIKASMRKKKPMTIYERLQSKELKENSKSFMNNIEKSVYVSPELSVFLEEPKLEDPHTSTTLHKNNSAPKPQPTPRQSTPSGKQRENPFNRTFLADDIPNGEKKSLQLVGTESVSVTPLADKQIPHTEFESPQVSNQQPAKIFQGEEEEGSSLALKRNSRTSETYKSLQDIHVISSRMPNTLDSTNQEMLLSADNVSSIPTTPENTSLQSKRMKRLSKSVPAFPENDDADSMSEGSFQMDKHGTIASSLTNISGSSGMASRSSVSGSTMSIYSSDIGNIDVRGKIQFSLDYVDKLKEFHIFVVRCSDLAAAEEKKNRSDPYVKSYLLPDKIKTGKRKTTVKKRTLNPVYNEILRYKIDKASLMAQTLNLSVWHNDTFGRNSFLGEVEVELRKWDWSNKKMDWHDLKPRTISANRTGDKGSLKVAFRYIPQGYKGKKTGEVQIWVKEASNLPQIRPSRLDPFVKCFILPDTSRKSRQKTRVVKKSTNPVFNHTMVYDGFSTEDLKDACVELSVWDHDKLINHFLGGLRIGLGTGKSYGLTVDWMDSTEEEISVWDKMMTHPNTWVEDVLPLRMLMLSKMSGT